MFNLQQYLEKFKHLGAEERILKEVIKEKIKQILKIEIEEKNISTRGDEIIIKAAPTIKNSIYIKKEEILKAIKETGGKNIKNIR